MSLFFETIKIENGVACNLKLHNLRLNKTIKEYYDTSSSINLSNQIKIINNKNIIKCRVLYDREIQSITYNYYKKRDVKSFKLIYSDKINYSYKFNNRNHIQELFDQREDCDDILIIKNGLLSDSSISNVAILYKNRWLTPKKPLLCGTMRAKMLDLHRIKVADISCEMLKSSEKIALLNAMIEFDVINDFVMK
jgi:4-amino-4-deoxychorismate lyase